MSSAPPPEIPSDLSQESNFQHLTRFGLACRGLLYIVVGVLVIGAGRTEDLTGAIEYLGHGSGRLLLVAICVGMTAYGLWRLAEAAFGMENSQRNWLCVRRRIAAAFIGLVYLLLAYKAASVLVAKTAGVGDVREHARTVLNLPGGQWMLGAVAVAMAIAGLNQLREAVVCAFLSPLRDAGRAPMVKLFGRSGYAARGVIFLTVAALLAQAAIDNRSAEAGGMAQALDNLSRPFAFAVAAGLMLFGLFSLVEARFRRIEQPPVAEIKRQLEDVVAG